VPAFHQWIPISFCVAGSGSPCTQRCRPLKDGILTSHFPKTYSRSERFQLIRSPSVVLLLEEVEEEALWSLSRSL
jgi:hypothetical protein